MYFLILSEYYLSTFTGLGGVERTIHYSQLAGREKSLFLNIM